eukprot:COSAG01_NODE_221_length_21422_cov_48.284294_20_plen_229_part_00
MPAARVHDYWQATAASLRRRTRTRRCRQLLLQQSSHWWWRCCYWRCNHGGTSLVRPATPRTSTVAADGQHRCVSPVVWTPCVVLPLRADMGALGPHLSRLLGGAVCIRSARSSFPRSLGNAPCRIRAARHRVVRGCCVRWPRGEPVPPVCVAHLLSLKRAKEGSCAKGHLACLILSCWSAAQVLLAVHQMLQHLIYYRQPLLQKVGVHSMPDAVSQPVRTVVAGRWPA